MLEPSFRLHPDSPVHTVGGSQLRGVLGRKRHRPLVHLRQHHSYHAGALFDSIRLFYLVKFMAGCSAGPLSERLPMQDSTQNFGPRIPPTNRTWSLELQPRL